MADTAEFHAQRDEMESTVYQGITNLIQKAYNEENPRGRNAASLAVHSAMARVMADVCTDRKVEVVCEIEQSFVENWALTHFLMKDKQDHFMRLWLKHQQNTNLVHLDKIECLPYKSADIDTEVINQPAVINIQPSQAFKDLHNGACNKLKVTLARLAYKLRHEIPAIGAAKQAVEVAKQKIENTVPEAYRAAAMEIENNKLNGFAEQLKKVETSCFYFLKEEEEEVRHLTKTHLAGDNGFVEVPTIDNVIPVDEHKHAAPLTNEQLAYDYKPKLDELREKFESQTKAPASSLKRRSSDGSSRGRSIKFPIDSKVQVHFKQAWWPVTITNHFGSKGYQVTYDAGEIEGEVKPKRIKFQDDASPAPAPAPAPKKLRFAPPRS